MWQSKELGNQIIEEKEEEQSKQAAVSVGKYSKLNRRLKHFKILTERDVCSLYKVTSVPLSFLKIKSI